MVTTSSRQSMTHDTYTRIFGSLHMTPFMLVLVLSFCLIWYVYCSLIAMPSFLCSLFGLLIVGTASRCLPIVLCCHPLVLYMVLPLFLLFFLSGRYCALL